MKRGDRIIIVPDFDDYKTLIETECGIVGKEWISTKDGGQFHKSHVFPAKYKDRIIEICKERAKLKAAYMDSDALIYHFRNKITLEEREEHKGK